MVSRMEAAKLAKTNKTYSLIYLHGTMLPKLVGAFALLKLTKNSLEYWFPR